MRFLIAVFALVVLAASCGKDSGCTDVAVGAEDTVLIKYDTSHGVRDAIKHPSGMYYKILSPGGSDTPNINSKIRVRYTGYTMGGILFDGGDNLKGTDSPWALTGLVEGWQIAVPLIGRGGKISITIPSSLGYGCQGSGSIGANNPLHFEIELVDFE